MFVLLYAFVLHGHLIFQVEVLLHQLDSQILGDERVRLRLALQLQNQVLFLGRSHFDLPEHHVVVLLPRDVLEGKWLMDVIQVLGDVTVRAHGRKSSIRVDPQIVAHRSSSLDLKNGILLVQ